MLMAEVDFTPQRFIERPNELRDLDSFNAREILVMEESVQFDWLIAQAFTTYTFKDIHRSPFNSYPTSHDSEDAHVPSIMRFFSFGPSDFETGKFELMEYIYQAGHYGEYRPKHVNFSFHGLLPRIQYEGFEARWGEYVLENRFDNWGEGRAVKITIPKLDMEIGPDRPLLALGKAFIFTKIKGL